MIVLLFSCIIMLNLMLLFMTLGMKIFDSAVIMISVVLLLVQASCLMLKFGSWVQKDWCRKFLCKRNNHILLFMKMQLHLTVIL